VATAAQRLRTVLDYAAAGSMPQPVIAQELEQIIRDIVADELERQQSFYAAELVETVEPGPVQS
jgi:hypothetical protein